jgi:hypothetical protein
MGFCKKQANKTYNSIINYKDSYLYSMSITFETKVWENDWEIILGTDHIERMIKRCYFTFDEKILYINNVKNINAVQRMADALVSKQVITKYIYVEEYAQKALDFFSLSKEKLGIGYYYSIAELVSIYLTDTQYLLHFSGDSIVAPWTKENWLSAGIATLKSRPEVKVFNLTWNRKYKDAKRDSKFIDKDNYYGYGFSDQMYLIRTADFKERIYEHYHPSSDCYPSYGGELFEKRVYSWLKSHDFLRATYRHGSYLHQNFPHASSNQLLPAFFDRLNPFK